MKILVIRFSSLGDIVLTTPVLTYLKNKHKNCEIHYVTKRNFSDILSENKKISHIFQLSKQSIIHLAKDIRKFNREPYDIVYDLHNSMRSRFLLFFIRYLKIIKYKKPYIKRWLLVYLKINLIKRIIPVSYRYTGEINLQDIKLSAPEIIPEKIDRNKLDAFNEKLPTLAIAPGAKWFTKRWPLEYFSQVLSKFCAENKKYQIIILGGPDEIEISNELISNYKENKNIFNFTGKFSVRETAWLLSKCKTFLTNDSGLMHVASVFNIKIIALFLCTVEEFGFAPLTKNAVVLSEKLPCKPCDHKGLSKCPKKHFKCAHFMGVDKVYNAVLSGWRSP
ncbi:MAG: glycosyltransferase family 9 protein [Spirochaetia bacterium]|nr:glycosyltransferase family 9 protein [Spirochaetia bacterium]